MKIVFILSWTVDVAKRGEDESSAAAHWSQTGTRGKAICNSKQAVYNLYFFFK